MTIIKTRYGSDGSCEQVEVATDTRTRTRTPLRCTYCGEDATGVDHLTPRSFASAAGNQGQADRSIGGPRVPCCRDCNLMLGSKLNFNVGDRRTHVYMKLHERFGHVLQLADWTEEELSELGPAIKSTISAAEALREKTLRRIAYAGRPYYAKKLRIPRPKIAASQQQEPIGDEPIADTDVATEQMACAQCRRLFAPKRPSQVFCCTRCRSEYHVDHGASGKVAGVRRIHRGASIVIHLTGPAAEAALQLLPGQKVRLVDAP